MRSYRRFHLKSINFFSFLCSFVFIIVRENVMNDNEIPQPNEIPEQPDEYPSIPRPIEPEDPQTPEPEPKDTPEPNLD